MTQQVVSAFFDSRADADSAVAELASVGVPRSSIKVMPDTDIGVTTTATPIAYDADRDDKGFWASLGDLFLPDNDRHTYAEAINRGSIMVSATVDALEAETVEDVLEKYGTVDIDEREAAWRKEGWSGYAGGTTGTTAAGLAATARTDAMTPGGVSPATGDEIIPIVEEKLIVGKRQVNDGRVRVRSYVVETPVSEQVNLRKEHVQVERRAVDRPITGADEGLFRDRTIEAEERSEEARISKEARVTEELVIKKNVEQRTETVQDTVRHTEVDVDDERSDRAGVGTTTQTRPAGQR